MSGKEKDDYVVSNHADQYDLETINIIPPTTKLDFNNNNQTYVDNEVQNTSNTFRTMSDATYNGSPNMPIEMKSDDPLKLGSITGLNHMGSNNVKKRYFKKDVSEYGRKQRERIYKQIRDDLKKMKLIAPVSTNVDEETLYNKLNQIHLANIEWPTPNGLVIDKLTLIVDRDYINYENQREYKSKIISLIRESRTYEIEISSELMQNNYKMLYILFFFMKKINSLSIFKGELETDIDKMQFDEDSIKSIFKRYFTVKGYELASDYDVERDQLIINTNWENKEGTTTYYCKDSKSPRDSLVCIYNRGKKIKVPDITLTRIEFRLYGKYWGKLKRPNDDKERLYDKFCSDFIRSYKFLDFPAINMAYESRVSIANGLETALKFTKNLDNKILEKTYKHIHNRVEYSLLQWILEYANPAFLE